MGLAHRQTVRVVTVDLRPRRAAQAAGIVPVGPPLDRLGGGDNRPGLDLLHGNHHVFVPSRRTRRSVLRKALEATKRSWGAVVHDPVEMVEGPAGLDQRLLDFVGRARQRAPAEKIGP